MTNNDFLDNPKSDLQAAYLRLQLAFEQLTTALVEQLTPTLKRIIEVFKSFWECLRKFLFSRIGNRRVKHLANHAKKARVRKKNQKRLRKIILRGKVPTDGIIKISR